MNRRDFLHLSSAALAAFSSVSPSSSRANDTPGRKLKKAIMWGTVPTDGSVREKLRAVKAAGFHGVELNSHMDRDEVKAALAETGLEVPSVCNDRHWAKPLSSPDSGVRDEGRAALEHTLRDAHAYGATSILLVPGVVNQDTSYHECWQRSVEAIRGALPLATELGITISIENVWNNFITMPGEALRYLDEIGSAQVGWHFDCGNVIRYGDPIEWIDQLGKRITRVHVKEYSRDKAMRTGNVWKGFEVPLLQGANNWPGIMKALDAVGYQGYLITEQRGDLDELSAALDTIIAC